MSMSGGFVHAGSDCHGSTADLVFSVVLFQSPSVGPTLPCTQVMFEERSRVKACASPDDMASRWKDAMQVSSCPTLGGLGGGGLCRLCNS